MNTSTPNGEEAGPNFESHANQRTCKGSGLALGLPVGVGIGAAMGSATHNMGVWLSIGAALGVCFGLAISYFKCERQ
jgi:hypothetical protein